MHSASRLLRHLAEAPDSQIDKQITPRLRALAEQETPDPQEMKAILDECANAGLASKFAIIVMDLAWKVMREKSG